MLRTIDKILMVIADGKRFGGRLCGFGDSRAVVIWSKCAGTAANRSAMPD